MTDLPRGPEASPPTSDDDRRDEQLAAVLDVPPLDEATRHRLVRTAATAGPAASRGGGRARGPASGRSKGRLGAAMGVAAALVVGAVVGAVVVTRPSEPDTPSAAGASSTAPTTAVAEAAAPAPQSADAEVSAGDAGGAPPQALGNLGLLRGTGELRAAIDNGFQQGVSSAPSNAAAVPCGDRDPGRLGLVVHAALGEAQLDGLPVVVLVGPSPTGQDEVAVHDPARGCEIVERLTL
jgi:hypothetical protein